MEPISHFFYSDRLKLQFWDYGQDSKPPLILVHGGLDHARSWDWTARVLRDDYHVYALDLRGHGNSAWAPGAIYSMAEHVLDLSVLIDIITKDPIRIVGHSLGGMIALNYSGVFPERVHKVVSIEGLGFPLGHKIHAAPSAQMRNWIEAVRKLESRNARSYPDLESAVARMKEANKRLSDDVARHLTLHGTNWNADGSMTWKFDNYVHAFPPYGHMVASAVEIFGQIKCPSLLFWGLESWAPVPTDDPRRLAIPGNRLIEVPNAGHWLHHDQLDFFLKETRAFMA
ncbi:MAG TPA: alpha/beta hydrolase [Bryobacteraceae bacterium]|jgi:pimeloyl-ACP methyl ester carboxylesterase|nr:alpha/beta hydrolase [Bryobacteraceae bacterium]